MNTLTKAALTGIIKIIIGKDMWSEVSNAVVMASRTDMTGEEKRAAVFNAVKKTGWVLAGSLLNLAIEIAVTTLTKKAEELK